MESQLALILRTVLSSRISVRRDDARLHGGGRFIFSWGWGSAQELAQAQAWVREWLRVEMRV